MRNEALPVVTRSDAIKIAATILFGISAALFSNPTPFYGFFFTGQQQRPMLYREVEDACYGDSQILKLFVGLYRIKHLLCVQVCKFLKHSLF